MTEIIYGEPPIYYPVESIDITKVSGSEVANLIETCGYTRGYVVPREDNKTFLILCPGDEVKP